MSGKLNNQAATAAPEKSGSGYNPLLTLKLIKNEFLSTIHSIGFIYIVDFVLILMSEVAYAMKNEKIGRAALGLMFVTAAASIILTFFMVVVQFNKSLYGNQGYLSFTLPVSTGQLLFSKGLIAFFWMMASWVVSGCAIAFISKKLIAIILSKQIGDLGITIGDLAPYFEAYFEESGLSMDLLKRYFIALAIVGFFIVFHIISELYLAVTLSNTRIMQKLGVFSIILVFFVLFIVTVVFFAYFTSKFQLFYDAGTNSIVRGAIPLTDDTQYVIPLGGIFFELVSGALLFVLTSLVMDTKVSLK